MERPDRSLPHCGQKRPHPRCGAPHFGHELSTAGTELSSCFTTSRVNSSGDSPGSSRSATSRFVERSRAR